MSEFDEGTQTPSAEAEVESPEVEAPAAGSEQVEPNPTEEEDLVSLKKRLGELREEVGRLRVLASQPPKVEDLLTPYRYAPPPPPEPPKTPGYEEIFYADPNLTAKRIKEEAKAEALREIEARENQRRQQEQFVNEFYAENKDLDPKTDGYLVEGVAQRLLSEIPPHLRAQLDPNKAKAEVARRVREIKASYEERARKKNKPVLHVGPGGGTAPTPPVTTPKKSEKEEYLESLHKFIRP